MMVGFKAKNHPQQHRMNCGPNDAVDDRALPPDAFAQLHGRFQFTIDVAASESNAKLPLFLTKEDDGLSKSWAGDRVYCNPPYSHIEPWVKKAWDETENCPVIVLLLPANRTEQLWWHNWIEPRRDRLGSPLRIEFLYQRTRFLKPGQKTIKPNERPPFGCCLAIWRQP